MNISLVGKKIGMTLVMKGNGSAVAVSVIEIKPNIIVQKKTKETDGYNALQLTTGKKTNRKGKAKTNKVSAALKGHYAKAKSEIGLGLWESRVSADELAKPILDISMFSVGHFIDVTGVSKGKGFQGGVKRHNFKTQDATHGNSLSHRALGSTGQCQEPGRVFKGKKMPGHMGNKQVTSQCLKIINIDDKNNLLLIKGGVPGANGSLVRVKLSAKKSRLNTELTNANKQ